MSSRTSSASALAAVRTPASATGLETGIVEYPQVDDRIPPASTIVPFPRLGSGVRDPVLPGRRSRAQLSEQRGERFIRPAEVVDDTGGGDEQGT